MYAMPSCGRILNHGFFVVENNRAFVYRTYSIKFARVTGYLNQLSIYWVKLSSKKGKNTLSCAKVKVKKRECKKSKNGK